MKRAAKQNRPRKVKSDRAGGNRMAAVGVAIAVLAAAVLMMALKSRPQTKRDGLVQATELTYNKQVAPIIYANCSGCHRPGQSGPFNLLTYADVKKHGKEIVEVTSRRFMPPWLPGPGYNHFVGERVLNAGEIEILKEWVSRGMLEGSAEDLPAQPTWHDGWQLGKPDLVVTMPKPYILPAEGKDVYRNFVVPMGLESRKLVRAVDFSPGNKAVHHVFMLTDRTPQSRRLDEQSGEPGFEGMGQPGNAMSPPGQFLSWRPGKMLSNSGSSWELEKGSDLVLQMHMQTTGKPETIQPQAAFYFTETPPDELVQKLGLESYAIDIPAGEGNYLVQDSYRLPVDVEVLGILPHAHYLGKILRSYATLPDGKEQSLLYIKDWDFNWQSDFYYSTPIQLPRGSVIHMDFGYDNSTNNVRNPSNPPVRVRYGLQTTDEMANLAVLLRFKNKNERNRLNSDYQFKAVRGVVEFNRIAIEKDPNDAHAHTSMGKALLALGNKKEAEAHLRKAISVKPTMDDAHYHLGLILEEVKKQGEAKREYQLALQYNPDHLGALNNLGLIYVGEGDLGSAEASFRHALKLAPDDPIIRGNLNMVEQAKRSTRSNN
jgi:tetratricopeptide (TPR) repeat protein